MNILNEDSRQQLLNRSKSAQPEKQDNKTRYQKRLKSRISQSVYQYNDIDMNKLFKNNIFSVGVNVRGETDNYVVLISFGELLDEIKYFLSKNNYKLESKVIIQALTKCFNSENVYIHCSCPDWCLEKNTKIKLLSGEILTIEDMLTKFKENKSMWVYSVDNDGNFNPGKVTDIWISGYTNTLIKVTLDNDKEVTTTLNHKYLLADGSYCEASMLSKDTLLFNHSIKNIEIIHCEEDVPVYDISVDTYNNFLVDADVVLHNCYRMAYWATRNKINSGEPQYSNGKWIRNPDDKLGPGCKHSLLVLSNADWIIKSASVILNYIRYAETNMQSAYARLIYPKIYDKEYQKDVQLSLIDTDELDSRDIERANKYAKTKTQFQKGNKYRYQKQDKSSEDQLTLEDE